MTEHENLETKNGNFGAFLAGTISGGIAAAVTMLLLAPRSGPETQDQIRKKAIELRTEAEKSLQQGLERVEESISESLHTLAVKIEELGNDVQE
jgi:gas vesicle protein